MGCTMLQTFCAAANIKSFVQMEACPDALRQLQPLLDPFFKADTRGTLMSQLLPSTSVDDRAPTKETDRSGHKLLDKCYQEAMISQEAAIKVDFENTQRKLIVRPLLSLILRLLTRAIYFSTGLPLFPARQGPPTTHDRRDSGARSRTHTRSAEDVQSARRVYCACNVRN